MSDVSERLAGLTPAQRALLERRLIEKRAAAAHRARITRREVISPVALSYSQELIWLLSQLEGQGIAYNAPGTVRLTGPVSVEALRHAFNVVVARHEILRTTYNVVDGTPMQIVAPTGSIDLEVVDLAHLDEAQREEEVQRILLEGSQHAFDLRADCVLRPILVRMGENDHVFFHVLHHIATDGWSRGILHYELTEAYDAYLENREPDLPDLTIQYADYAVWHRKWLDDGVLDQQLSYWKETLRGAPSRLELPTDRPRPAVRGYHGAHESRLLDVPLRDALQQVARNNDATLFMALLASFATLLNRYSGQDDIVIGTPFAGRNRSELERMIGYFINPLALRVDLSGKPSFRELLGRARKTTLGAFAHADVPYEVVVRATSPKRDLSQTPVYQVMMALHNPDWQQRRPTFEPKGVSAKEVSHAKGWSKFDVLLGTSLRMNGLNTTAEYSTELFEQSTIFRMLTHLEALVRSAIADPDKPISALPMLSQDERSLMVSTWAKAPAPFPKSALVKDLFEESARRTPDAEAVVLGKERFTYRELNERANRLAHRLRTLGVGPGVRVGIFMEKSPDLVAAVLAVVKSGGAYVPLDPLYPRDRIEFMLEDAAPKVLIAAEHAEVSLEVPEGVAVFSEWSELETEAPTDLATLASRDDLAYIIYTSGSTGKPKGAMITNGSLVNAWYAYDEAYRLSAETSSHLQMASFSFDVFTGDFIRALLSGSKLVLCPLDVVMDPPRLYDLMVAERVDCAEFVPAVATLLFQYVESIGRKLDLMRVVVVSSEGWRTDKYAHFKQLCGSGTRLINAYGLTEATIDSTYFESGGGLVPDRFVPIGRPLANSEVYILDDALEPAPIGVPAELCIGGDGVALGYLNRPELTAERFVPNPFSENRGRLYRTGDLARWLPDGNVEFLGRTDRQVKIRGFRIEPGEVEAALERHAGVRTAAVVAREDRPGDAWLAAYVEAADPRAQPTASVLRDFLRQELPAFMVPSAFVVLDALPLSPNGKVDRDALPEPERGAVDEAETVLPRNETERKLVEIWRSVLDVQGPIGVTDDFFALGGHSLLAVRVFGEVERVFGKKLPLALLFQGATIAHLAEALKEESDSDDAWSTLAPLHPQGTRRPLFLMHGIDGEVLFYRELIKHIDPDQPVYALQPAGLDGKKRPHIRLEDMAAEYVKAIQDFQPEGPYLLGGHCFSGVIAYEVARQLLDLGDQTAFLGVIDGAPVGYKPQLTRLELERAKFADFRERNLRGKMEWIVRRTRGLIFKLRKYSRWFVHDTLVSIRRPLASKVLNVHSAILQARSVYKTPETPCRVTLFRAGSELDDPFGRLALWRRLAQGGVDVRPIGGVEVRHDNILDEPYVQLLAAEVNAALAKAIAEENAAVAEEVA